MKKILHILIGLFLIGVTTVNAQTKIKDGTVTGTSTLPNSNAILELESNNKGLLLPRVALTVTTSSSPLSAHVKGVTVYNTAHVNDVDSGLYFNDGTKWVRISSSADSATAWLLHGNTGTNAGTSLVGNTADGDYVGTTDGQNLVLAAKGIKRAIIDTAGNIIGGFNSSVTPSVTNSFVWGAGNLDSANHSFVLGDTNTLSSLSNYSIVSGWGNTLTSGTSGTYDDQSSYSAVFGWQNSVSSYGSVVGGEANVLGKGSGAGTIVVGGGNSIITPQYVGWNQGDAAQNALFGFKNAIVTTNSTSASHNNIVQGTLDTLSNASFSALFGALNTSYADRSIMTGTSNIASTNAFYSAVFGNQNKDSANSTLMSGENNTISSSGDHSIVNGYGNNLTGNYSAVFGAQNIDSAEFDLVSGQDNILTPSAHRSIVTGAVNFLSGDKSAVFGKENTDSADYSLVSGFRNKLSSEGRVSIVGGYDNSVTGEGAGVFGEQSIDSANYTLVAGIGNTVPTTATAATVIGQYNTPVSNMLLAVGNGTSSVNQSNAITVTNTTAAPTATANNSTLNINGSVSASIVMVGGDYTFTNSDYTVIYTGGSTPPTFTLPDPSTCKGRIYHIRNGGLSNPQTITFNYNLMIGVGAIGNSNTLNAGGYTMIQSDGSNWWDIIYL